MKTLEVTPHGWPCKLEECPLGLFSWNGIIAIKVVQNPYINHPKTNWECYEVATGDEFWGSIDKSPDDGDDKEERKKLRAELMVSPCILEYGEVVMENNSNEETKS